jgi:hypothetical protein
MEHALATDDWQRLRDRLMEFVTNFEWRVVKGTAGFQM